MFNNHIKDLENKNELIINLKFSNEIAIAKLWRLKRKICWNKFDFNSMITIFKLRKHNLKTSFFELLFARVPNFIFEKVIYLIKNRNL